MTVEVAELNVECSQYYLADPGHWPQPDMYTHTNGLVCVQPGIAVVFCGRQWGLVRVSLDIREDPSELTTEGWDEIVEVSLTSGYGQIEVQTMSGTPDVPYLTPFGPGYYRLRVHARNRDISYQQGADGEAVEEHLIQVWPAPLAPEVAHKHTDALGTRLRTP